MNNKGFTLIELLLSIALIAIISLIITPTIANVIKNNKIESCKKLFDSVEQAAKTYVSDNRYNITSAFSGLSNSCTNIKNGCNITASELKTKGYISGELNNPLTKNTLDITVTVKLESNKKYTYTVSPTSSVICQ